MKRLRIAWLRLTGCSGCQLSLLNAETELTVAAGHLELVAFPLVSSAAPDLHRIDVALVEGALSTPDEMQTLLELRRRAPFLIATGACALSGGIPALAGDRRGERFSSVYGDGKSCTSFPPQAVHCFVSVDLEIPGCPPEPGELLNALASATRGGLPETESAPVCFECRQHENLCLLFETSPHAACLGPLTRSGCAARCPSQGVPCEGCRGPVPEARTAELLKLLEADGFATRELHARLERFGGGSS